MTAIAFVLLYLNVHLLFTFETKCEGLINDPLDEIDDLLNKTCLIDGHNDLPYQIYLRKRNKLYDIDLVDWPEVHTDIKRLRQGKVGAQFWAVFSACATQYKDATRFCVDQVDVIYRFVKKYSNVFQLATSSREISEIFEEGKIASLIGIEGGHCIDSSVAALRIFYKLGARYLSLTHNCDTPWVSCNINDFEFNNVTGLTDFGKKIILEMNRLGMIVDLSHVSKNAMLDALNTTLAPIIFSHSNAYSITAHPRNVQDDVLLQLKKNNGLIMVTFPSAFVSGTSISTLAEVAEHIEYIKNLIGVDHLGIGSDFDGTSNLPVGLEDVSKFPNLIRYLHVNKHWSLEELKKLVGQNFLRVFKEVERISDTMQATPTVEDRLTHSELGNTSCRNTKD